MITADGAKLIKKVHDKLGYKIGRDSTANAGKFSYDYTSLPVLYAQLMKVLKEENKLIIQPMSNVNGVSSLTTIILDPETNKNEIESTFSFQIMQNPQDVGKQITYFRRYSLMCLFGLISDDDDDAESTIPMSDYEIKDKISKATTMPALMKVWGRINSEQKESMAQLFTDRKEVIDVSGSRAKKQAILEAHRK